jgi:hypothetical protein
MAVDQLGTPIYKGDYVKMSGTIYQLTEHDFGLRWYGKRVIGEYRGDMVGVWTDLSHKISPEEVMIEILKGQ